MRAVLFLCLFIKIFQGNLWVCRFCEHASVPFNSFEDVVQVVIEYIIICSFYISVYENIFINDENASINVGSPFTNDEDTFIFFSDNSRYANILNMFNSVAKYLHISILNLKFSLKAKWKPLFKKMSYVGLYISSKNNKNN